VCGRQRKVVSDWGNKKIVFLVGMPRSGTTLLIEQLARYRDIEATAETHFFRLHCRSAKTAHKELSPFAALTLFDNLNGILNIQREDSSQFRKRVIIGEKKTCAEIVNLVFKTKLNFSGKSILIEKTPDHLIFSEAVIACFPEAQFIYLVRDPRDVALSWQSVPWNPAGLLWPLMRWRKMVLKANEMESDKRFSLITIRYEDLLSNPAKVLKKLAYKLQINPSTFAPGKKKAATFDPVKESWKAAAMEPVNSENVEKWRLDMESAAQYLAELLLGRWLKHYGYPLVNYKLSSVGLLSLVKLIGREFYLMGRVVPKSLLRSVGLLVRKS